MENRRLQVKDGHDAKPETTRSACQPYRTPRLKVLGVAAAVIRGSQTSGYTDQYHDFYHYGE